MNTRLLTLLGMMLLVLGPLAACGTVATPEGAAPAAKKTYADLVVGYAQIGAESQWRAANTLSIQEAASELGVTLKFADAQQKQENQIAAIREFIAAGVDVIGVSPVVETGWDEVFGEVKAAGIPLIILDRNAAVPDELYASFIGADFAEEGRKACVEMAALLGERGTIVEIEGTAGSAPALKRKEGFHACLAAYPEMQVLTSATGDFTRAQGKVLMEDLLSRYGDTIDGLYAHNDDMALGAIEAIEAHGLRPGVDLKIVSIDAAQGAFEAMIAGKLNVTVECTPLLGPQFFATALKLANGEPVERWVISIEDVFRQDEAAQILPTRKY